jgi:hypothetical protein
MDIKKRAVCANICNDLVQNSSIPIEEKNHKCWRRFMNKRATDRAYIPTIHGIFSSILITFI